MAGGHLPSVRLLADELSGSEATQRVLLTSGAMVLIGVALLIATVWWWRSTRPEHPVLAPLEVMSDRRWSKADPDGRRRMIDESRVAATERAGDAAASAAPTAAVVKAAPMGIVPAYARPGVGAGGTVNPSAPERVDLSLLVRSVPVPDDMAEMDILLGLAPAPVPPAVPRSEVRSAPADPAPADRDSADGALDDGVPGDDRVVLNGKAAERAEGAEGAARPGIDPLLQRTRD